MRRAASLAVGFLLLLLAGCSEPADEATTSLDTTADGSAPEGPNDPDASGHAGDEPGAPPASGGGGAATQGNGTGSEPTAVAVSWSGNLGTFVMACELETLGWCQGYVLTGAESRTEYERSGATLAAADLTLRWDALAPTTETLVLRLEHENNASFLHEVAGTSPLVLDAADLALPMGYGRLLLSVHSPDVAVREDPFYAYVGTQQEFTLDGTLSFLDP